MKEPRGPEMQYTTTNKKSPFLFPVQMAIPPKRWEYQLLQCLPYSRCKIEPSHAVYSYVCLSNHPEFHQYVLKDYHSY